MIRVSAARLTFALAIVASSPACEPATATVPLESAGSEYAAGYCARAFACCTASDLPIRFPVAMPPVSDEASCRRYVERTFGNEFYADVRRSQIEGRAVYRADGMAACIAQLRALSCPEFAVLLNLPRGCVPVEGRVLVGGACDHDFQCVNALCQKADPTAEGVCALASNEGDACRPARCADGLRCNGRVMPPICERLKPDGAACQSDFECQSVSCNAMLCGPETTCDGP